MRSSVIQAAALGLILAGAAGLEAAPISAGSPAPAFAVRDQWQRPWTQAGLPHGAVLVDFWASWCAPCLEEIPDLNALQARHGAAGKFAVLGLNLDKGGPAKLLGLLRQKKVAYAAAAVDPKVAEAYGLDGFPSAVLLKDGKVVQVLVGKHSLADFEKELAPYLR